MYFVTTVKNCENCISSQQMKQKYKKMHPCAETQNSRYYLQVPITSWGWNRLKHYALALHEHSCCTSCVTCGYSRDNEISAIFHIHSSCARLSCTYVYSVYYTWDNRTASVAALHVLSSSRTLKRWIRFTFWKT